MDDADLTVLGIETSCDETGLALYNGKQGILADALHSQTDLHTQYGGVVPEVASRDHVRRLLPLLRQTLQQAGLSLPQLGGIAYTTGPGLAGALLVGASFGRSMAYALRIPAIGVHHMEGHLLAPRLAEDIPFPFLALLVSGGHTQITLARAPGHYKTLGETLDDAAGETLDKVARLLKLPYPGGPALAQLAEQGRPGLKIFPRPMAHRKDLDFSFSGLKTSAMRAIEKSGHSAQERADLARGVLDAVIDSLVHRCERALHQTGLRHLVVGGGVAANTDLRERLKQAATARSACVHFPPPALCTDNGVMIAYAGYLRLRAGQQDDLRFTARPRWPLDDLPPYAT